jgi:hypothetical protein
MFEKTRAELQALSADQVTERLGNVCEQLTQCLTDKSIGPLHTVFRMIGITMMEHLRSLREIAADKNGITDIRHEEGLAAIVAATEKRGSDAARKIKVHIDAVQRFKDAAVREGLGERAIFGHIKLAKRVGPEPGNPEQKRPSTGPKLAQKLVR